jgi:tRNA nucleotidyltransferase/poly(A) polymerase
MKLYLVGGTVRDHLFGLPQGNDVDFAVEAESFAEMESLLVARGLRVWQSRPEFVTVRGQMPLSALGSFGGLLDMPKGKHGKVGFSRDHVVLDADFTLCRAETQYSDGRHPDSVTPATLAVDLARRDFTVNAVAVSEDGQWVDLFKGKRDADYRVLKCVGNARDRFDEDPLRILRALRFSVKFSLMLDRGVEAALNMLDVVDKLGTLPVERVREELGKAFAHNWLATAQALTTDFSLVAHAVQQHFPNLWLKATTEEQ